MSDHQDRVLYLINKNLDAIFWFAQERKLECYTTRITDSQTGWVIEFPKNSPLHTRFLLEYSHSVENIMGTYYV